MKLKKYIISSVCVIAALAQALSTTAAAIDLENEKPDESLKITFKDVSLGAYHGAAVSDNGFLYTWGNNVSGQLGDGSTNYRVEPAKVTGIKDVKQASMGTYHSAAVTEDGSLYTWGDSNCLGYTVVNSKDNYKPQEVRDDADSVVLSFNCGAYITKNHQLFIWNSKRITDSPSANVYNTSLHGSYGVYAFVTGYNELFTYGDDRNYQLGYEETKSLDSPIETPVMTNVTSVALGKTHSAAITTDGELYMWGENYIGQLGNGTYKDAYTPVKVESLEKVKAVSLGDEHSAAITENGDLYVWGANDKYQLGTGSTVDIPKPKKIMENVKQISLSGNHCAAIKEDGTLWTWGEYALGYETEEGIQTEPKEVELYIYKKLGDVNDNGKHDSEDALKVLRISLNLEKIDEDDNRTPLVSDYDKDGSLTSADALMILRRSVGY